MSTFTRIPWTGMQSRLNRAINPVAAVATTGYSAGITGGGSVAAELDSGAAVPGIGVTTWFRARATAAGTSYLEARYQAPVVASPYTFSAYLYTNLVGSGGRASVFWYNASDVNIGADHLVMAPLPYATWTRVTLGQGLVPPGGTTYARVVWRQEAATVGSGSYIRMTGVLFENTAQLRPFFYGDTPDTTLEMFEWVGAAHSNPSRMNIPDPAIDQVSTIVEGPFEYARVPRTIARELLHSSEPRVTYVPATYRTGEYQCLFDSHEEARDAADWFAGRTEFIFSADTPTGSGYEWVDGYLLPLPVVPDVSFDNRFIVAGADLQIVQRLPLEKWQLTVPYKEFPL